MALIGLRTNTSLIIFAVGNVFMQAFAYSFGDFHHPEALMMITLSVLALSPAGGVLSIDDLRRRLRLNAEKKRFSVFNIMDENSAFARWPLLLVQWILGVHTEDDKTRPKDAKSEADRTGSQAIRKVQRSAYRGLC